MNERNGPLKNIRILDLSQTLAGPFATTILSDLGAEIIKIEKPNYGDQTRHFSPYQNGESHYFLSINRNKKSVTIDLKGKKGKEAFWDLVKSSDVVIENFRPNVMEKLGFSNEEIKKAKPEIVICSISAFGRTGPLGENAGYDIAVQALSGLMSLTGEPNNPVRAGLPIADLVGGLYGAISILGGIIEQLRTTKGLIIDLSLLDNMVSLLGYFSGKYFMTGEVPKAVGDGHPFIVPYGKYKAKNGFMVLAIYTEKFWERFTESIDKLEWKEDQKFKNNENRIKNENLLNYEIEKILQKKTLEEWSDIFSQHDVPHAPILDVEEILNYPQIKARDLVKKVNHPKYGDIKYVGSPIKYQNEELNNKTPPPLLGEHTEEVLSDILGYNDESIKKVLEETNSN